LADCLIAAVNLTDTSAAQCFSQKAAQVIYIDNSACVFFRELLVAVQAAQAAGEMTGE
jgi:hypothetical protein